MSIYCEPDLAALLPEYYCVPRGRQPRCSSVWKGICTHLFAMTIAIGLYIGGYYYYQNVYLPEHKEGFFGKQILTPTTSPTAMKSEMKEIGKTGVSANLEQKSGTSERRPEESEEAKMSCQSFADDMTNQISYLKDELSSIHNWRTNMNQVITQMQWEQDMRMNSAIQEALEEYEADRIGLMDYAAAYAGGTVEQISRETRPLPTHRPLSLFKIVNVDVLSSPDEMLRPCVLPGSCFAFRGRQGLIRIKLGKPINVGGVTLSHASKFLLGLDGMSSAPKEFEIYGLSNDEEDTIFLGKFSYDWMGQQHQTFPIKKNVSKGLIFESVELKILSNYGKEEFTCVYRFRVHKRDEDISEKSTQTSDGSGKKKRKCC